MSDLWNRSAFIVGLPAIAAALGVSRITLVRRLRARGIVLPRWKGGKGRNSPVCVIRGYLDELKKNVFRPK